MPDIERWQTIYIEMCVLTCHSHYIFHDVLNKEDAEDERTRVGGEQVKEEEKKKTHSQYGEIWMFNMRDKVVPSPLLLPSRRSFLNKTSIF